MIITVVLDEGNSATGTVSKVLTVLPIGGTVATGNVCILDTALTIGGTATVGITGVRVPTTIGGMDGKCFFIDAFFCPASTKCCG